MHCLAGNVRGTTRLASGEELKVLLNSLIIESLPVNWFPKNGDAITVCFYTLTGAGKVNLSTCWRPRYNVSIRNRRPYTYYGSSRSHLSETVLRR